MHTHNLITKLDTVRINISQSKIQTIYRKMTGICILWQSWTIFKIWRCISGVQYLCLLHDISINVAIVQPDDSSSDKNDIN